jgi:hypothetical protein
MDDLYQEILKIVQTSFTYSNFHTGQHVRNLMQLAIIHGWKEIMRCMAKIITDKVVTLDTIHSVLYGVQEMASQESFSQRQMIIDIAFDYSLSGRNDVLLVRALKSCEFSKDENGSYFLFRLAHDDEAKIHVSHHGHALTEVIIKSASKCALYELKNIKNWISEIKNSELFYCGYALNELTRCIDKFAGMKYTVNLKDIMIVI